MAAPSAPVIIMGEPPKPETTRDAPVSPPDDPPTPSTGNDRARVETPPSPPPFTLTSAGPAQSPMDELPFDIKLQILQHLCYGDLMRVRVSTALVLAAFFQKPLLAKWKGNLGDASKWLSDAMRAPVESAGFCPRRVARAAAARRRGRRGHEPCECQRDGRVARARAETRAAQSGIGAGSTTG